jgi:hypothetical protein
VKRTVVLLSLALGLAAVGCRERQSLTSPHRLSADFSDGRVAGGNPHFFFLPPIIGQATFSGILNPNLAPVVEICQLEVDPNNIPLGCNATAPLINPGPVLFDGADHYQVDWHTDAPAINPALFYRIQVFSSIQAFSSGTKPLGFADIDPVANGSQLKNVNTGEFIGLVDGRTLPIKFRIEQGATCFGQTDCVEQTLGPSTSEQHVVTSTGFAGVSFPAGYFTQTVTLTIHRVPEPCLNTPFQQFEGCYSFATSPLAGDALGCLVTPTDPTKCARVEVCLITTDDSRHAHIALFRSDPGLPATELPEVLNGLINCTGFGPFPTIGLGPHGIADLARASWRSMRSALGRLLGPEPLYAGRVMAHLGLGGLSCCFSNFAWALPLQLTVVSSAGDASAPVGSTVTVTASVQYLHDVTELNGTPGVPVTFKATNGTLPGSVLQVTVPTLPNGTATVSWTISCTPGANQLVVTAPASGSPATITVTGTGSCIL